MSQTLRVSVLCLAAVAATGCSRFSVLSTTPATSAQKPTSVETVAPAAKVEPPACPAINGLYQSPGTESMKAFQTTVVNEVTEVRILDQTFKVDGKLHSFKTADEVGSYLANCEANVLHVKINVDGKDSSLVVVNEANSADLKMTVREDDKVTESVAKLAAAFPQAEAHVAAECVDLSGKYTDEKSEMTVTSLKTADGASYGSGKPTMIADGKPQVVDGKYYVGTCVKDKVTLAGDLGMFIFEKLDNGSVKASTIDETGTAVTRILRAVDPNAAPVTPVAPAAPATATSDPSKPDPSVPEEPQPQPAPNEEPSGLPTEPPPSKPEPDAAKPAPAAAPAAATEPPPAPAPVPADETDKH